MYNQIPTLLVCAYVFINAIPHTPAARYIILGLLVITALTGLFQKWFCGRISSPIVLSLSAFVIIAFISALTSPYTLDSLQSFRKDFLPPLLVLLMASCLEKEPEEKILFAKYILWSLLAGFAVKTGLALWDGAINNPFIFSPYSNEEYFNQHGLPKYVGYYAVESVLYMPITYAALVWLPMSTASRITLGLMSSASFFMIAVSGIRSAFVATAIGLILITLLKLRTPKRILTFSLALTMLISIALWAGKGNVEVDRYVDLFKAERYSKKEGMSGRYFIWEGVSELIQKRPLLGYGPGWQKIPEAATDSGLITKWQEDQSPYAQDKSWYFSMERGKANPHNMPLQVLFETGWFGLVGYMSFVISLFWYAIAAMRNHTQIEFAGWLRATAIGYAAALATIDITNSFVLHNTLLALAMITVLFYQSSKSSQR